MTALAGILDAAFGDGGGSVDDDNTSALMRSQSDRNSQEMDLEMQGSHDNVTGPAGTWVPMHNDDN
jgi:hypothetical protein